MRVRPPTVCLRPIRSTRRRWIGVLLAFGLVWLSGCGSDSVGVPAVAAVSVQAPSRAIGIGERVQLEATVSDAAGRTLAGHSVTWTSSNAQVATVSQSGVFLGVGNGTVTVTASSDGRAGAALMTVVPTAVTTVTIAPDSGRVLLGYGLRLSAALSDITGTPVTGRLVTWSSADTTIARVGGSGLVEGLRLGTTLVTATSEGVSGTVSVTVIPQASGGSWIAVSAGAQESCGLTASGTAYCWGWNDYGQLGAGSSDGAPHPVPAPLFGAPPFRAISVGAYHSCAVALDDRAWCWGRSVGELGVTSARDLCGTTGAVACSTSPVEVAGGIAFRSVAAGNFYSCGLALTGAVYCWGWNDLAQLGTTLTSDRCYGHPCSNIPVLVSGSTTFASLTASSGNHSCALTLDGAAYCWGANSLGELGSTEGLEVCGEVYCSYSPRPAAPTLSFRSLSAGMHSCGVATNGAAWCWGDNRYGQLGNGQLGLATSTAIPQRVLGDFTFRSISAGAWFSCGVTTDRAIYCWGYNQLFQLGTGLADRAPRRQPTEQVAADAAFAAVSTGWYHACGLALNGALFCWGDNGLGSLGSGSAVESVVPIRVRDMP
ncbi:MAG: Ig-like domain-containing protein [Gemmatimonadaceae bacterium]